MDRHLSPSGVRAAACPRRWAYRSVGVEPAKPKLYLIEGRALHRAMESRTVGQAMTWVIESYVDSGLDRDDPEVAYSESKSIAMAIWLHQAGLAHPKSPGPSGSIDDTGSARADGPGSFCDEQELSAALLDPRTGEVVSSWHLTGRVDAIRHGSPTTVYERKFVSVANHAPAMSFDSQTAVYLGLSALQNGSMWQEVRAKFSDRKPVAVLDVFLKPNIRPRKEEPANGYMERCLDTLTKGGDAEHHQHFEYPKGIWEIELAFVSAAHTARSLDPLISYADELGLTGIDAADTFPQNDGVCKSGYGMCDYFRLCDRAGCSDRLEGFIFKKED